MNIAGRRFGRLTVLERNGAIGKSTAWKCECDCGKICIKLKHHLTAKANGCKSCGCLKKELRQSNIMTCKTCKNSYDIDNFYFKSRRAKAKTRHNVCKKCLSKKYTLQKKIRDKATRMAALEYYGGSPPKCKCCGESKVEFLTIDHINGGGNKHRKSLPQGSGSISRWLRNNKYPKGYRVLCINCNYARGVYGYCPHERENNADIQASPT